MTYCLKRKNKKRFFSFQSMPNLNFAELIEIGYYRGGYISCLNHAPTPHKAVFGATTRRIRLE
jgi:hypothetical protein